MPENVLLPHHEMSDVTFRATAAVIGKRFVAPSANRTGGPGLSENLENVYQMAHAPAGGRATGVARYDTPINTLGGQIGTPGRIVPVTAEAAIAAGATLQVGAAGQAITQAVAPATPGIPVAVAMSGAAAGADVEAKIL